MKKVRYVIDDRVPFVLHGEGLTVQAVTRKSKVPVTVEIEGMSRRVLLQFKAAIRQEMARREQAWKRQRDQVLERQRKLEEHDQAMEPVAAELAAPSLLSA